MAILNFPDNPQLNAQYTGDNGTTYIFDGVKWVGHAVAQPAGTNSITNNGFTLQMGADGNLIIPTGSHIYYQDGTPLPDAQGPRGATGPEGPRGLQGAKGDKGDTGLNGENGLPGQNGLNGTNGINGVGQKGDKGDKGDTGAQGVSVTLQGTKATIADLPAAPVDPQTFAGHGWIVTTGDGGTHADGALWFWNLALAQWDDIGVIVGPKGDKGDTGERGLKGDTGENGTNGQNGLDGENGINGLNGEGVPTGGTIGQLLFKVSSTDFDTEWNTLSQSFAPNARTGVANTFVISPDQTNQVAITGPYTDVDHQTAQRLVIAGRDSYYDSGAQQWLGEGGDLYLWAGKGANGGDIKVDAGDALGPNNYDEGGTIKIRGGNSASGTGGFLDVFSGSGYINGGNINITSGTGQTNNGGDIIVTAGSGGTLSGKIILQSGGRPWTFNPDGSLSGPSSGATLNFGAQPLREPSWGSKNELITLYDFNTPGQINYGIGVGDNFIWTATDSASAGFKWFGGEANVALELKGDGELNIVNNIRQGDARINLNENGGGVVYLTPTTDDYAALYLARDNIGLYTQDNISLSNVKTRTSLDVVNVGTSNDNTITVDVTAYPSITGVAGDWTLFFNNTNYSINNIAVDTPSAGLITITINGIINIGAGWVTFLSPTIWNDWNFDANGDFNTPYQGRIVQGGTGVVNVQSQAGNDPHAPFVIYTSQRAYASSIKMVIQIEGWMDGDDTGWHSQACEALVSARGAYINGTEPVMTVYGVVYTGANPMATISIRRNQLGFIEVLATYTQTRNNGLNVSVHATEMFTLN